MTLPASTIQAQLCPQSSPGEALWWNVARRQGQEWDQGRNVGSVRGSQEQEKNSLSIVPRSSCQQHPLPTKVPLSPSCELPPQCLALALGLPTYSRSQHSSGVQSGRPRLVNSFFKKIHTLVWNTVALAPVLVPRDQMWIRNKRLNEVISLPPTSGQEQSLGEERELPSRVDVDEMGKVASQGTQSCCSSLGLPVTIISQFYVS